MKSCFSVLATWLWRKSMNSDGYTFPISIIAFVAVILRKLSSFSGLIRRNLSPLIFYLYLESYYFLIFRWSRSRHFVVESGDQQQYPIQDLLVDIIVNTEPRWQQLKKHNQVLWMSAQFSWHFSKKHQDQIRTSSYQSSVNCSSMRQREESHTCESPELQLA